MSTVARKIRQLSDEHNERLAAVTEFLGTKWGPIRNTVLSDRGLFGCFVDAIGPVEKLWPTVDAKVNLSSLAPQRRGADADMHIVVGELPHGILFKANVRPAIAPGRFNIDIELTPTLAPSERETVQAENVFSVCEELLGDKLTSPEMLALFMRRQLIRNGDKRMEVLAALAMILADELRESV